MNKIVDVYAPYMGTHLLRAEDVLEITTMP